MLNPQFARRALDSGPPGGLATVFTRAGFGVGDARSVPNMILIETDRVHALRQKAATVRIDEPENSVVLRDAEISVRNQKCRTAMPPHRVLEHTIRHRPATTQSLNNVPVNDIQSVDLHQENDCVRDD